MPKTLKGTRIKGLPPKMQLRNQDALTGSYPAHPRLASDNRTGNFKSFYDDTKTVTFKSYSSVALPSGLPLGNAALSNPELNTNITASAVVRKGIGDEFVVFAPVGQAFQPFRDNAQPAVDGISVFSGSTENAFYATGSRVSDVGDGFDQPLWSKSKIEIDLTPAHSHSFFIQNYTSSSNNYPMAYWNKDLHLWQGIGNGKEFGNYVTGTQATFQAICEDQCIGFGNGLNQGGEGSSDFSVGAKISNFGFPYHVKYHATSSNLVKLSDFISEPFMVEKIVLEWSGTLTYNSTSFAAVTAYSATTFFILNQRQPFGYNDPALQQFVYRTQDGRTHFLVTGTMIPSSYNNGATVNTIRDLVTYAQVIGFSNASFPDTITKASRELNFVPGDGYSVGGTGAWTGRMVMSATVKNALPNDGLDVLQIGHNDSGQAAFMLINKNSTRSGLFTPGGRDFVGALEKGHQVDSTLILNSGFPGDPVGSDIILDRYSKINPYILMPTDQLIFGWQLPIANRINSAFGVPQYNGKGTELIFAPIPSKITIYGSLIREQVEFHDTLNQLLTSVSINEAIE